MDLMDMVHLNWLKSGMLQPTSNTLQGFSYLPNLPTMDENHHTCGLHGCMTLHIWAFIYGIFSFNFEENFMISSKFVNEIGYCLMF